jgi:integrase
MASIRRRPGRPSPWEAVFRDPSGRQQTRAFRRKVDAQRWLDEQTAAIVTGQYISPTAGKTTVRDYGEQWRAAQVHRQSSADRIESILRLHVYPLIGDRHVAAVRPSDIQAWVKRLLTEQRLAPSTVAVVHGVLAAMFKSAVRDRMLAVSPCEGTRLPENHRQPVVPLAVEQVLALEAALPARWRARVSLGAAAGPRVSEALGLTVDRTGLKPPSTKPALRIDRQLVVRKGETPYLGPPKRKASRRDVPVPRVLVEALAKHLTAFPPVPREMVCRDEAGRTWTEVVELVFTTARGEPLTRSRFGEAWRQGVVDVGLPAGTSYHDLRHFYASLTTGIDHGESVIVVQRRLGHASATETLDTYSHCGPTARTARATLSTRCSASPVSQV